MAKARTLALKTKVEVTGLDKLTNLGKKLQSTGKDLTKNYTVPLLAAGVAAFKFASDVDESAAKANTVFGAAAAGITKEARSMTDALDEATFLDTAGTFGALLTNMGFVQQEAADLSIEWLRLSEDMASFHNANPEESLQAIRSALSGEFEPLKRFGVMLNVATIEARALEMGLWDGTGAIDAQTRALVVNAELFRQQPAVIGDYERTAAGAANTTRRLWANFKDTAATLGQELLPAGTEFLNILNGLVTGFKNLSPETRTWIIRIAAVTAVIGPVLIVAGKFVTTITTLIAIAPKLGLAFHAMLGPLGLVTAAVAVLATDFLGIRSAIEDFVGGFHDAIDDLFGIAEDSKRVFEPLTDAQWEMVEESGNAWAEQRNVISDAMFGEGGAVATIEAGADAMAEEMGEAPGKMADELLAAQFRLTDATSQLVAFMEQAISPAQEMMELQGFLASQELAQGLADNNPLIRQKSAEMRDAALSRLSELQGAAYTYGNNVGTSFAAGMNAAYGWVQTAAGNLAAATRNQIGINSEPRDHSSPLYGITKWGGNAAKTFAAGITSNLGLVSGAWGQLAGAMVPGALATATSPMGGGSGSTVINNNFTFNGVATEGPNEVASLLRRLAAVSSGDVTYG